MSANNLFCCVEIGLSPVIDSVEKVAGVFDLSVAALLAKDLLIETPEPASIPTRVARMVSHVVEDFLSADDEGRRRILDIAEQEAERSRGRNI